LSYQRSSITQISTLYLHDALPIFRGPEHSEGSPESITTECRAYDGRRTATCPGVMDSGLAGKSAKPTCRRPGMTKWKVVLQESRSEEHTSELQSQSNLVCRLLLEK